MISTLSKINEQTKQNIQQNKINEYKNIIINSKTYNDSLQNYESIKKVCGDKNINKLLDSYINQKRYYKSMDNDKFFLYLNIIDGIYFKNDAEEILTDIKTQTENIAQINTLERLINKKPPKLLSILPENKIVTKYCPHCNNKATYSSDIIYVVCGYTVRGYDWKGCGRDWCFQCNKRLCKSWNIDMLYNIYNRKHTIKCCKTNAQKLNLNYKNDYCQCNNKFVQH